MMACFIAVPLKKTCQTDLVKPLKNVFSNFCVAAGHPESYDDALNELNKLRINSTRRTLDKREHESSLDIMTRYYDQLNFLDAKCPSVDFQVSFKWKDAFDKSFFTGSASLAFSTLAFEKTCILFNIGAMQSQVACSHISDTKNDEGLKLAAKYFQMSSGTFQYLKTLAASSAVEEPTPDLKSDTLSALHALMLAQAQESFFFKATSDNMKDAVIAKVASYVKELYSDALQLMRKDTVNHLWEKDWLSIVSGKQSGFHALAEYYQSLVCKAKKDVGEEIARLQKALDLLKIADAKGILASHFKDYKDRISHNYDKSKKDNDFIYHARVPDYESLAPIEKAALARPILPGEKLNPNSQDMFSALLLIAIHKAMSAFSLRKAKIINGEKAKLWSKTQRLNSILVSLNLSAALEDTTGSCLSQSLKEKIQAVRNDGGIDKNQSQLNDMPMLLQRNKEVLNECERLLNAEEESDNELRGKFGNRWILTPSAELNAPLKDNLRKYKQDLLLSAIPTGNPVGSCSSVDRLKSLMREVDALKSERESLISELESATTDMKAKFTAALSSEGQVNEEAISLETIGEIYEPIQKRIRDNISRQEELVRNIQFYNTTKELVNFQNRINDFCIARKTEKEELCKDLQKDIVLQPPSVNVTIFGGVLFLALAIWFTVNAIQGSTEPTS